MSTTRATAHRLPVAVPVAIAAAWAVAVIAQASGKAELLHHDALIEGHLPLWVALCLFLLAWQVMIAAMMLPSTLPMVRLFAAASTSQERPGETQAAFLAGYLVVWTVFGALAFVGDMGLHHLVDATPWLAARPWLIAGSARSRSPAPSSSPSSRTGASECRHPGAYLLAHYRRGVAAGVPARAWTRAVLPGLLLGADAADVRGGRGQPLVDGGADRGDGVREGWTRGGPDDPAGRSAVARARRARAPASGLAPVGPDRRMSDRPSRPGPAPRRRRTRRDPTPTPGSSSAGSGPASRGATSSRRPGAPSWRARARSGRPSRR